jgi:poly-beta-1,6-N-acetyl-D-glucosamine biosynthesis protein PgaD
VGYLLNFNDKEIVHVDQEKKPPLINQPTLQKTSVRGLQLLASATAWGIFLYFLQTLFTTVVWLTGGKLLYHQSLLPASIEGTKSLLINSCYFAIIIFLLLFIWANWNYWRFGRLERRKPRPPISDEVIATYYGISLKSVYDARAVKIASLSPQSTNGNFIIEIPLATETKGNLLK